MRAVLVVLLTLLGACRATPAGLRTLGGTEVEALLARPLVVLLFLDPQCPIANAYTPEIRRIQDEYGPRGVEFLLVYADPDRDVAEVRAHLAAYGHVAEAVLDPRHELVARTGARMTPEACVLAAGELVYRGRIDDRWFALGKQRAQATTHELRDALDALLSGARPAGEWPGAIGCYIPPAR